MSEQFDFSKMEVKVALGRKDFIEEGLHNVKYQSDKFAVVEINTALKNGVIGPIGENDFSFCVNDDSTLFGEKPPYGKISETTAFVELGIPIGWRIYDVNMIGRYTIAVFLEHSSLKEAK
jgi:hypothetical protein